MEMKLKNRAVAPNGFKSAEEAARAAYREGIACSLKDATRHFRGVATWSWPYDPRAEWSALGSTEEAVNSFNDRMPTRV